MSREKNNLGTTKVIFETQCMWFHLLRDDIKAKMGCFEGGDAQVGLIHYFVITSPWKGSNLFAERGSNLLTINSIQKCSQEIFGFCLIDKRQTNTFFLLTCLKHYMVNKMPE